MIERHKITDEQIRQTMSAGEFGTDIRTAAPAVAVVLTQSWCSQWKMMSQSLDSLGEGPEDMEIAIFTYEYDLSPLFQEFMTFKEATWKNWEVPYVRLYKEGRFVSSSNFTPAGQIIDGLR